MSAVVIPTQKPLANVDWFPVIILSSFVGIMFLGLYLGFRKEARR